jgi:hypothetical protein
VVGIPFDVGDWHGAERVVAQAAELLGPIDILVNNAVVNVVASIVDYDPETFEHLVTANLTTPWYLCQLVFPELIDGRTDHHLWTERYDRDLRAILELQSDVARAVAREVEIELSSGEATRLAKRPWVDPAVHDELLNGIFQASRGMPDNRRSAIASFERAIELDPEYAPAHAWLALAWYFMTNGFFAVPDVEGMPKAKAAALRALELDGALPEAPNPNRERHRERWRMRSRTSSQDEPPVGSASASASRRSRSFR